MLNLLSTLRRFPVELREVLAVATLSLPRGAIRRAVAGRHGPPAVQSDPVLRDPEYLGRVLDVLDIAARRYFRWEVRGAEHIPAQGAALLVGSHNGGLLNTDSYLTLLAVRQRLGLQRALHVLSHDIVFFDPVLGRIAARLGILRAGHESASQAFGHGRMVLVYPGSDLDTFRRFSERGKIELGGRTGFIKLVLRQGVPIVPVVSAGTHEQLVVIARGEEFARRSGLKTHFRAEAFPLVLSAPWGLTTGFLPYLPLPAQTTLAFGKPIAWPELGPSAAEDPVIVGQCYERVRSEMQALLDTVTVGRKWLRGQGRRG